MNVYPVFWGSPRNLGQTHQPTCERGLRFVMPLSGLTIFLSSFISMVLEIRNYRKLGLLSIRDTFLPVVSGQELSVSTRLTPA